MLPINNGVEQPGYGCLVVHCDLASLLATNSSYEMEDLSVQVCVEMRGGVMIPSLPYVSTVCLLTSLFGV